MHGHIIKPDALILRVAAGEAKGNGVEYELSTSMSGTPLIKSSKTGNTWAIGWEELIGIAIASGINEEAR